jgi:hypothetical protein
VSDVIVEGSARSERALPTPAIDACDLQAAVPGLDPDAAARAVVLATLAVEAAIWPNELPAPPLPPPLQAVLLTVSARLAGSSGVAGTQIVSESIGAYSYRLSGPPTLDTALGLTDAELDALEPWMSHQRVYELSVVGAPLAWPVNWWQCDYDNLVAYVDEQIGGTS